MATKRVIRNDSEENDDWMKTLPGYQDEIQLHEDLANGRFRDSSPTMAKITIRSKDIQEAPNYRQAIAITYKKCRSCRYFQDGQCQKYNFAADPEFVCDSWED